MTVHDVGLGLLIFCLLIATSYFFGTYPQLLIGIPVLLLGFLIVFTFAGIISELKKELLKDGK